MHTIPSSQATDPISQNDLSNTKLQETMAVSQDVVPGKDGFADASVAQTPYKAVVTPEGSKTSVTADLSSDESMSPPYSPPRVASVFSTSPASQSLPSTGNVSINRTRILSLDRAGEDTAAMDKEGSLHRSKSSESEESSQADSSDGESSYFAKHLPSPKSGRRFSYSSDHSAPATTSVANSASFYRAAQRNRPSDASLSFSDESDDDDLPHSESPEPVSQLPRQVADLHVQSLTRVHSVSSLVSSDGSHAQQGAMSPQSTLSPSTTSEPSVNAELQTIKASGFKHNNYSTSSGRRSPLPGDTAFVEKHFNPSPSYAQRGFHPSPPTIFPGYSAAAPPHGSMHYPPPQLMSSGQMATWMAPGDIGEAYHQPTFGGSLGKSKSSSDGAFPFVYSDDETEDNNFMHQLANGPGGDAGGYNTFSKGSNEGGSSRGPSGGNPNGNGYNGTNNGSSQEGGKSSYGQACGFGSGAVANLGGAGDGPQEPEEDDEEDTEFKVYWQRWIMLFYMSILNLLSDWTCYSVAPIAILTQETFGEIDPERLVVIFLGANAVASALEPIILARLGLKKTVLFGALLLMVGSIVKSGGLPPIFQSELEVGDEWRLSLGFFLVGLSQPLYQCTPALLSASWFPERERTMATGVALNANQLGIGCAFVFGTLLVATSDDIPSYFGLLSMISTLAFIGTLIQFDDAPPTPPSSSAKVMKGDITVPDMGSIVQHVRKMSSSVGPGRDVNGNTRRRSAARPGAPAPAPSPALWGRTRDALAADPLVDPLAMAPSPMMPGPVQQPGGPEGSESPLFEAGESEGNGGHPIYPGMPYGAMPPPGYQNPYMDPRMQQPPYYQQQAYYYPPPPQPYYYGYQNAPPAMYAPPPPYPGMYGFPVDLDEGAEPVLTVTDHHLDIDIRDDQVILAVRACFSRPGFIHCLVSFTVSGIVINTLSTYMDYLVTLNGAGREYVGVVGGAFQGIIMISSLIIGKQTDKTRAYYSVIIGMLVLGAFGLAECGVSLDADRGSDLRWSLLIVAALVGPLQPVSTELGVEVAYPLSENTVLVIQQLFSNLLSALFIPFFKSLRDIGIGVSQGEEKPQYTFSFYLLIVLHAGVTVFFATFNGRYLRYEHELEKEAKKRAREEKRAQAAAYDSETHPLTSS